MTNGVMSQTKFQCNVLELDKNLWYHPKFITNILSFILLKNKFNISYDTENDVFIIHRYNQDDLKLYKHPKVL